MFEKRVVFKSLLIVIFSIGLAAQAQAGNFFTGIGIGTLGGGVDLGYQFNDYFKVRVNGNYLPVDFSKKYDGIEYDAELRQLTAGLLLDLHPFAGKFRISAGAYYRDLELDLDATPHRRVKIGDTYYDASEIGKLEGNATWDKFAPYVGIGWGMRGGTHSNFSFDFNLGAMYLKGIDISYKMTGPAAAYGAQYESDIKREAEKIEDDIDKWNVYPVINFFMSYRF